MGPSIEILSIAECYDRAMHCIADSELLQRAGAFASAKRMLGLAQARVDLVKRMLDAQQERLLQLRRMAPDVPWKVDVCSIGGVVSLSVTAE